MEENIIDTPTSGEDETSTSSTDINTLSDPETEGSGSDDPLSDDPIHILLYELDEDLTEFQFIDTYPENPTIKEVNYNLIHIYNLVLLICFFLIGKWIFDKTFTCFNSLWKRW